MGKFCIHESMQRPRTRLAHQLWRRQLCMGGGYGRLVLIQHTLPLIWEVDQSNATLLSATYIFRSTPLGFRALLLVPPGNGAYWKSPSRAFFHGRSGSGGAFTWLTSPGGPGTRPSSSISSPRDAGRDGVGVLYDESVTLFVSEFNDSTARVVAGGGGVRDVCICACVPGNIGNSPSAARASSIALCRTASSLASCSASSLSSLSTSIALSRPSNSAEAQCGQA